MKKNSRPHLADKQKQKRLGEVGHNYFGTEMIIVEYNSATDIVVEFQDDVKFKKNTTYNNFKKHCVSNPYDKEVCGVACIGNTIAKEKGKVNKIHDVWCQMIRRCYSNNGRESNPAYKDCTVCEEWLCFENYEKWYKDNYYEIEGQRMCVDKDILLKGNKIYSPNYCCIVPNDINVALARGTGKQRDLPQGVRKLSSGKYQTNAGSKNLKCSTHSTIEEAFYAYKIEKEKYIKQVADKYKDQIPQKVYDALYNYEVEITD